MGKRKPTVPRRRVGTNFADLTVHRTAYIDTRRSSDGGVGGSVVAEPNGALWSRAQAPVDGLTAAVGQSPPPPSATTAASGVVSTSHSHSPQMALHTQQGGSAVGTTHHHVGKSTTPTVPTRQQENGDHGPRPQLRTNEETVTMTVAELESWKQRTIMQIEDHFTNEQLKRIAEFGRVHANLVKEAKEYVAGIETQLKEQFERERESLTRQAEAYVAQFQQENDQLRQRVQALEEELEDLQQDDEQEEEEEEEEMEATEAEATMETMESRSPIPDVAVDGSPASGGDSTDDSSMTSVSPDLLMAKQTVNSTRVDAVAETMQRAMEIQTTSPTEDMTRRSASPSTTHEGSPIDANDGPRRTTTPKNFSTSGTPPPEMASTEYL